MNIIIRYKKTILISFLLIWFCTASFIAGMKYDNNRKLNQERKYYLNQLYYQLDNTISLLSSVDNWGSSIHNTDITANPYRKLLVDLNSIKDINKQAEMFMINERNSHFLNNLALSFRLIGESIGSGVGNGNQTLCADFLNDGTLSKNEISFLVSLKQDLQSLKNNLYSEETKQENPKLTMKELSRIVKPFTDKYSADNLNNIGLKN